MSTLEGLLVVDKPEGPTSHDVVARVRRLLRERRIGHTGTLDPLATGVLPLLIGPATRLAQFLTAADKSYRAGVRLGFATTTYDREGEVAGPVSGDAALVSDAAVEEALAAFRGTFLQTPPAYSAKKVGGVSAHRLARRGDATELAPVQVTVHELRLVSRSGADLELDVRCSAGFYVRSLAHELGTRLGCGAHLQTLRRTASGRIDVAGAAPLEELERDPAAALARLQPTSALLTDWPAATVTSAGAASFRHGRALAPADCEAWPERDRDAGRAEGLTAVRVLNTEGRLLGLADWTSHARGALLHPRVVLV